MISVVFDHMSSSLFHLVLVWVAFMLSMHRCLGLPLFLFLWTLHVVHCVGFGWLTFSLPCVQTIRVFIAIVILLLSWLEYKLRDVARNKFLQEGSLDLVIWGFPLNSIWCIFMHFQAILTWMVWSQIVPPKYAHGWYQHLSDLSGLELECKEFASDLAMPRMPQAKYSL